MRVRGRNVRYVRYAARNQIAAGAQPVHSNGWEQVYMRTVFRTHRLVLQTMKPHGLLLPSHVRKKQHAMRGRVLPSTRKRNKFPRSQLAKNPARILPTEFNFGPEFEVVMSLQGAHFSATTEGAQYAHMLYGWKPPFRVYSADKSGPSSSTARVHENEGKDKSKNRDRAAPTKGPPHKPPPVPPAPKMQETPIGMHGAVGEVQRAFGPPRADAGGTATAGQGREAQKIAGTAQFLAARANNTPAENKRRRTQTCHTRF